MNATSRGAVVIQLNGGLGNQLFQYAMGRRLALKNGVPLVLDHVYAYRNNFYKLRYVLDKFNIQAELVKRKTGISAYVDRANIHLQRRFNRNRPFARRSYIEEGPKGNLDPRILDLKVDRRVIFPAIGSTRNISGKSPRRFARNWPSVPHTTRPIWNWRPKFVR